MSAEPPDVDVVVVGAGPAGLLLAGELRLGGASVVVLEQLEEATTQSRASTVHSRTMELLQARGLLDRVAPPPTGTPFGHVAGLRLDLRLPGRFPGLWKIEQRTLEAVLQEWALDLGAEVRRGQRVESITQDAATVVAATTGSDLRARYLVACDGEDSTVRASLRAVSSGTAATRFLLRADVAGLDVPDRRFERHPAGLAVAARRPDGVTRLMVHEIGAHPTKEADFTEVAGAWKRVTGEDVGAGEPLWVNRFDDARYQLERYRHGRVLFAGDAAHRQMPTGGQSMNLALQDAMNLGWKLAAVVRGQVPDELLETYHTERHAAGADAHADIAAQVALLLGGPEVEPVRTLLGELLRSEPVRQRFAGSISGLAVRYPTGCDHPLAGTRWPGFAVPDGRGLLLDPAGRGATAGAGWEDRIALGETGRAPDDTRVLVRPDGYVAWAGPVPADPRPACERWFGAPNRH